MKTNQSINWASGQSPAHLNPGPAVLLLAGSSFAVVGRRQQRRLIRLDLAEDGAPAPLISVPAARFRVHKHTRPPERYRSPAATCPLLEQTPRRGPMTPAAPRPGKVSGPLTLVPRSGREDDFLKVPPVRDTHDAAGRPLGACPGVTLVRDRSRKHPASIALLSAAEGDERTEFLQLFGPGRHVVGQFGRADEHGPVLAPGYGHVHPVALQHEVHASGHVGRG
jgi:hypothetical protein